MAPSDIAVIVIASIFTGIVAAYAVDEEWKRLRKGRRKRYEDDD